jgi:hypothetical protein
MNVFLCTRLSSAEKSLYLNLPQQMSLSRTQCQIAHQAHHESFFRATELTCYAGCAQAVKVSEVFYVKCAAGFVA